MTVQLYQIGGFTGSYAGDAGVIKTESATLQIDLGRAEQAKRAIKVVCGKAPNNAWDLRGVAPIEGYKLLLTHFHKDHCADGKLWKSLGKLNPAVLRSNPVTAPGDDYLSGLSDVLGSQAVTENGMVVFGARDDGTMVTCTAIVPAAEDGAGKTPSEENDVSLGALLVIEEGGTRHGVLTIGDMAPKFANGNVAQVLEANGYGSELPLSMVKLSHHGSESNFLDALDDGAVNKDTVVLISGYTLTATRVLIGKLEVWGGPPCFMLFDDSIDIKSEIGTANSALLVKAGVRFGNGYKKSWPTDEGDGLQGERSP